MIDHLMIFAAGFGKRMSNLTANTPKPLIKVNNKPLLHHALEFAIKYQRFKKIIINVHYLADKIMQSVESFKNSYSGSLPEIVVIHESTILETGGAVKNAYKHFTDQEAIFTLNSDAFLSCKKDPFTMMDGKWDPKLMDFLLLLSEKNDVVGQSADDFGILDGRVVSNKNPDYRGKYYTYTGLEILKPKLVRSHNKDVFPIGEIMKQANVYAVINNGVFYHANNEEHLKIIENSF